MLQIEIDGESVTAKEGTSILEAALQTKHYIPHFCYHKKLSIAANCRMCLVQVDKMPKPLPACATNVAEGMKVSTISPMARQAQQGVLEFLLINHPLDCPICDQGGECQLQDLAVGYGKTHSRYIEPKRFVTPKDLGPLVGAIEMTRCIQCTRCTRFTEEIGGYQEIAMVHRGEHVEIMPFLGKIVESEISGNVIDLCPVGALTSLPFRYEARSWELSRRKSISAHDALGSNLEIQVKDKKVYRVLPRNNELINECWLSDKDRFAYEGLNHQDRIYYPMIKQANRWFTVSWETAIRYVAKGLQGVASEHGQEAVGIWAGANNTLEELYLLKKFAQAIKTPFIDSHLRLCDRGIHSLKQGAWWLGQSLNDFLTSDLIVIVGATLRQDQPLLTARIRQSVKAGSRLVVIQSKKEELHIPGVIQKILSPQQWDNYLASLLHQDGDDELAQLLAHCNKISIVLGEEAQLSHDYSLLVAQVAKLAKTYNGIWGIWPHAANAVGADLLELIAKDEHSLINMLLNPKKALILANVEPDLDTYHALAAIKVLKEAETVIVMSPFASEVSKQLADVILPITTVTETPGSFINMAGELQSFYSAVATTGETKPLWKVLRVLGGFMNFENFTYQSCQEVLVEVIKNGMLQHRLNNTIDISTDKSSVGEKKVLLRVGGVSIYNTDAIVRRAHALQQTPQAQPPLLRVNAHLLAKLSIKEGEQVLASQPGGEKMSFTIALDESLPDDVIHLPHHQSNASLGAMMDEIQLEKA